MTIFLYKTNYTVIFLYCTNICFSVLNNQHTLTGLLMERNTVVSKHKRVFLSIYNPVEKC